MRHLLTAAQAKTLQCLERYFTERQKSPTVNELQALTGFARQTVHSHLVRLVQLGLARAEPVGRKGGHQYIPIPADGSCPLGNACPNLLCGETAE